MAFGTGSWPGFAVLNTTAAAATAHDGLRSFRFLLLAYYIQQTADGRGFGAEKVRDGVGAGLQESVIPLQGRLVRWPALLSASSDGKGRRR